MAHPRTACATRTAIANQLAAVRSFGLFISASVQLMLYAEEECDERAACNRLPTRKLRKMIRVLR
jgi:hypothetical protein